MADQEKDETAAAEAPTKAPAKKPAAKPRAKKAAPEVEASPLNVSSFDAQGERSGEIRLPESVFGQEPNGSVMHQAYLRQVANARQGTAKTKKRGEVSGGGVPRRDILRRRARYGFAPSRPNIPPIIPPSTGEKNRKNTFGNLSTERRYTMRTIECRISVAKKATLYRHFSSRLSAYKYATHPKIPPVQMTKPSHLSE